MREAVGSRQIVYLPDDTTALAPTVLLLLMSCWIASPVVVPADRRLEAPTSVDGMALKHSRSLQSSRKPDSNVSKPLGRRHNAGKAFQGTTEESRRLLLVAQWQATVAAWPPVVEQ